MNEKPTLDAAIRAAYPDAAPGDALRRRIAQIEAPAPRRPTARRALIGALALAAVGAGVGVLLPKPRPASAIERLQKAVWSVRTAHSVIWRTDGNGKLVKAAEEWFRAGETWDGAQRRRRFYVDDVTRGKMYRVPAGTDRVETTERRTEWNPETKTVTERTWTIDPEIAKPVPLGQLLERYARLGWKSRIHDEPGALRVDLPDDQQSLFERQGFEYENGRIALSHAYRRYILDPKRFLPIREELWVDRLKGKGFVLEAATDMAYDIPLSPDAFTLTPPKNARRIDSRETSLTIFRDALRARPQGAGPVQLHLFFVTEIGQALLLYSAPTGMDVTPSLTDKPYGRRFTLWRSGPLPAGVPLTAPAGRTLHAALLDPDQRVTAQWPTGWEVSFRTPQGTVALKPEGNGWLSGPTPGDALGDALLAEKGSEIAALCRDRALSRLDGRWREDGPLVEAAERGDFDYLVDALIWYRYTLRVEARTAALRSRPVADPSQDLYAIAGVLDQLGRTREADLARREAARR